MVRIGGERMSTGLSEWIEWFQDVATALRGAGNRLLNAIEAEDPGDEWGGAIDSLREAIEGSRRLDDEYDEWNAEQG